LEGKRKTMKLLSKVTIRYFRVEESTKRERDEKWEVDRKRE
jgi:hypothetical protein